MRRGNEMNKKFTYIIILFICLIFNSSTEAKSYNARMGYQQFKVNGSTSNVVTYNINGENYCRIRDIAFALKGTNKKFDIEYNNLKNEINLVTGRNYKSEDDFVIYENFDMANDFQGSLLLNNELRNVKSYNIKGYNYYDVEDIAEILDFSISYENVSKSVIINTGSSYYPDNKNVVSILIDELNLDVY